MEPLENVRQRVFIAECRAEHFKLMKALRLNSYEPTPQEQEAYLEARVFWVREYPRLLELIRQQPDADSYRHNLYVLRQSFENPSAQQAIERLKELAHVDVEEAITAGQDVFEHYEGYLERTKSELPGVVASAVGDLQRAAMWLAKAPDWLEVHPQTIKLGLIALVLALAWQAPSILREATELLRVILGR